MNHLSKDELRSLLRVAKADSPRNWLMILVAYNHGLRASEAVNLQGSQIETQWGYITVNRLKGSLKTIQPLVKSSDPLLDETVIKDLAKANPGPLFGVSRVQFFRIMRKYGQQAGIPKHKCHPHVLKHSIAMHTIKTVGIENVRTYLGHKSISSTGEYLKVDQEDASKAVAAAIGG